MRARLAFDLVCPYSYLESFAAEAAEDAGALALEWIPLELRPPGRPLLDPRGDHLRTDWTRNVYRLALERGVEIHLPRFQPRSTLPLAAWLWADGRERAGAAPAGTARALRRALYEAFFCEGEDIATEAEIRRAAGRAGLDGAETVAAAWASVPGVAAARAALEPLDVRGVPTLVLEDGRTHWGTGGVARLLGGERLVPRPHG